MVNLTIYNTFKSIGFNLFVHYLKFHGIIVGKPVRSVIFKVLDVGFIDSFVDLLDCGSPVLFSMHLYGIVSHVAYFLFDCRMMGSLGDVTKVQAQYSWVSKPNCTEILHLLL